MMDEGSRNDEGVISQESGNGKGKERLDEGIKTLYEDKLWGWAK